MRSIEQSSRSISKSHNSCLVLALNPSIDREWRMVLKSVARELARLPMEQGGHDPSVCAVRSNLNSRTSGVTLRRNLLILSGSLPRGVPVTAYAQLIRLARRRGVVTLLDCDGLVFTTAIKARPFLVKPNDHELAEWWGKPLRTEAGI